ncbi:hypothetical protein AVEN_6692-1 [Araneus ventricosus]|uniref:Tc1-like transposase DDE domain-containing protein n=1 Tax=Araneus ventricosus TaxID=182803 RepID=A0A4Y2LR30_ARAVE|nr:hypothetical protein AVEN_170083-1 [Araneus ventricosus]GBN17749.1 hypothetical protein AVEN_236955-1 [Araneus ventricosus]GBN20344.1 hypothetical protein AVEN_6692-1 [Araneus ventricosus]
MKTGSALVPVMAVYWLEGGQQEHSRGYPTHPDCKFVRQSGDSTCMLPFMNSNQGSAFQQDTAVVTQHALQSVDMLPWPARSPYLSPFQHVWDIIGRQLQRHPQPTLTVPVLADQVQQAWNSMPQTAIRHLYDTMNARLHSKFWGLHRLLMYQHFTFEMALLALTLTCDLETLINSICYLDKCIAEISLLYNNFFLVLEFFSVSVECPHNECIEDANIG